MTETHHPTQTPGPPAGMPPPSGGAGGSATGILVASAVIALVSLIGGSLFVVSRRSAESGDGPDPTTTTEDRTTTTESTAPAGGDGILGGPDTYRSYSEVVNDTGSISVELPDDWTDLNTAGVDDGSGGTTSAIQAATDLTDFRAGFTVSGAEILLLSGGGRDEDALADFTGFAEDSCESATDPEPVESANYSGMVQVFSGCEGSDGVPSDGQLVLMVLGPDDETFGFFVNLNAQVDADFEALERILETLE